MSILKSILHRWNKDSKSYDTLHPETEVAQITDFADGIVSKLAATTAISAISALQTDSWFGKMMKWVLDASGVKYLIDTNGYVCFGSLFGGLIIQWGHGYVGTVNFPVAFTAVVPRVITTHEGTVFHMAKPSDLTLTSYHLELSYVSGSTAKEADWIAIGQ